MNSNHEHRRHADGHHHGHSREGAKQPQVFDPARAAMLDDPGRFEFLPPDEIVGLLDAPHDGVVIDFGAGTGTFSIEIAKRRPDLKVIALDEQHGMLDLMKAKAPVRELGIVPILSDQIDSIKGAADRVVAINVLHEVGDDDLRRMCELLKPEGSALIVDWDGETDRPIGPPKGHTHSIAEARERLEKAGFESDVLDHLRYHFVLRARRAGGNQQTSSRARPLKV